MDWSTDWSLDWSTDWSIGPVQAFLFFWNHFRLRCLVERGQWSNNIVTVIAIYTKTNDHNSKHTVLYSIVIITAIIHSVIQHMHNTLQYNDHMQCYTVIMILTAIMHQC